MTASLPVPHEPRPDQPDEMVARTGDGNVVEFSQSVRLTDAVAAASRPTAPRPSSPRAPRKRTPRVAPVDPGPPPPLPPEFAVAGAPATDPTVPPRPRVPVPAVAETVVPPRPDLPTLPPRPALPVVAAEVEPEVVEDEPEVASKPEVAEAEPVVAAEPVAASDPVAAEPETEDRVIAEPEPSAPLLVEVEPEPDEYEPETVESETPESETPQPLDAAPEPIASEEPVSAEVVHAEDDSETDTVDASPRIEPEELLMEASIEQTGESEFDALAAVFADAQIEASVDEDSAALFVRGVSKSFGETRAVEGIDLTVPAGSFYGLVGPNGAGKTTTLSMIAGLLTPDRGAIRVGGVDAASEPLAAKRLLGVLPDRLRTFDRLTGRQLLYYYGVLRGLSSSVVASRTADLARAFDLTDALGRVVSDYSAGMLKKVMLAGAMIHSPRVLVLDEPFEAVDPVSSAVILDILSAYVAHGGTVILSSHGMDLVERVCTRVAVIVAGQVLAEGTVEEVRGELTLEQRFIELAGGLSDVEGLEWLHTFSD